MGLIKFFIKIIKNDQIVSGKIHKYQYLAKIFLKRNIYNIQKIRHY